MQRKRIRRMLIIPLLVIVLVAVIRFLERPAADGISRAAACKAAALFLTTAEDCRAEAETERSHFSAADARQWYVKYMDRLYRDGVLTVEMTPPAAHIAEAQLTYGEAGEMAKRLTEIALGEDGMDEAKQRLEKAAGVTKSNRKKPMPAERFWELYEEICALAGDAGGGSAGGYTEGPAVNGGAGESAASGNGDAGGTAAAGSQAGEGGAACGGVREVTLQIVGTPDNVPDAPAWTAYTDQGIYGFEGLGLSRYIDCRIRVLVKEKEMIRVVDVLSEEVSYRNVWLVSASKRELTGFTGECLRTFPAEKELEESGALSDCLADLTLVGGNVERISVKREKITARVLAVREDAIELEGYGTVALDEDFCVYKTYGGFERQDLSQILVGYDTQEFIVAEGKLCAALIVRSFGAESIRVLILDTGFHSIFHPEVRLEFLSDCVMRQGETERVFRAGESVTVAAAGGEADGVTLSPSDARLTFLPADESAGIRVASVIRGQGAPVCPGRLEVACEANGLVIVNELYLEDYLKRVLPSEMPLSYEPEALRAQAVCARTYAYRQIRGNSCRQHGAHVDDSTNYQVYNNSETGRGAAEAVDATYGQILMYGDDAAETYYFSTSCGHTTDMGAWGQEPGRTPYLHAVEVRPEDGAIRVSAETDGGYAAGGAGTDEGERSSSESAETFETFIRAAGADSDDFESGYAMYRWQTQLTAAQLEDNIGDIGRITGVEVTGRGAGGVAQCVTVTGTEGTKQIEGESRIRAALGHPGETIILNDGSSVSGWASLPSAFLSVESGTAENGELSFTIYGGGYGHGIGMSQNGAQAMAKRGYSCSEILAFFYEGTKLETVY